MSNKENDRGTERRKADQPQTDDQAATKTKEEASQGGSKDGRGVDGNDGNGGQQVESGARRSVMSIAGSSISGFAYFPSSSEPYEGYRYYPRNLPRFYGGEPMHGVRGGHSSGSQGSAMSFLPYAVVSKIDVLMCSRILKFMFIERHCMSPVEYGLLEQIEEDRHEPAYKEMLADYYMENDYPYLAEEMVKNVSSGNYWPVKKEKTRLLNPEGWKPYESVFRRTPRLVAEQGGEREEGGGAGGKTQGEDREGWPRRKP